MEEVINGILIREVEAKNIMTKSSLPVGGYSVNPYAVSYKHLDVYKRQRDCSADYVEQTEYDSDSENIRE